MCSLGRHARFLARFPARLARFGRNGARIIQAKKVPEICVSKNPYICRTMDTMIYEISEPAVVEENPHLTTEVQYLRFSSNMEDGQFNMLVKEEKISERVYSISGASTHSMLNVIGKSLFDKVVAMMTEAVNNRTRQMNYFRLYSEFLEGQITEDEFGKELQENEDEYILQEQHVPSKDDAILALNLSRKIKNVTTTEDLALLFSFDVNSLEKLAEKNG